MAKGQAPKAQPGVGRGSLGRRLLALMGSGRFAATVVLVLLVALRITNPGPLEALRMRSFDFLQTVKPRESNFRPVVIVDIDDASLRELGQWPWPRTMLAELVSKITASGALVIGFDMVFSEPDRVSPALAAQSFAGLDEATRAKLMSLPSNDQAFADAIRRSRVVVGQSGLRPTAIPEPDPDAPMTGLATLGPDATPWLIEFPALLRNIPVLEHAALGRGLFTIRPERDGIIRRVPGVMLADDKLVPSLSIEMLRLVSGGSSILVRTDPGGVQALRLPGLEIPTDQNGLMWVYFARHDPAKYVPAVDVLQGRIAPDRLRGKLVLLGTSAVGLLDLKTTPVDSAMPGVEIHAQLIEGILTKTLLAAPNVMTLAEIGLTLALGLLLIVLAPSVSIFALFLVGAVVAATSVTVSWYLFVNKQLLFDLTFPLGASGATYVALLFANYARASGDRRRIRSAFGQYLSPTLVEQLAESPEKLVLGGEERVMTILFSDVRGFTTISESFRRDPQGLTTLINRLLTPLTNEVIARKGTIDKYMGDAVMAFWNAPVDVPDHEFLACDAALAMQDAMAALNRVRSADAEAEGTAFIPLHVGVGLNTGLCVVGNFGSDLRFNYSVLGDPVNLTSRLEGLTRLYGVEIILGSATAEVVDGSFAVLELDWVRVKGKNEPEKIFALLGRQDVAADEDFRRLRAAIASLLSAYQARDIPAAAAALERARAYEARFGLEEFFALHANRIRHFEAEPPGPDFDGVFDIKSK
jgi:adenylate cyclase